MANLADIFGQDWASAVSMTAAINQSVREPRYLLDNLGVQTVGIDTEYAVVEEQDGMLTILPTTVRGGPDFVAKNTHRRGLAFEVPHIPYKATIWARDIIGKRQFGQPADVLETAAQKTSEKLDQMSMNHRATWEFMLAGALQGLCRDVSEDLTTINTLHNFFTVFNVAQQEVDFTLGTAGTDIRNKCEEVLEKMEDALGMTPHSNKMAICSRGFFNKFVAHDKVRDVYLNYLQGNEGAATRLGTDVREGFTFGGITFVSYWEKVKDVEYMTADEGIAVPMGVPDNIVRSNAPGDILEAAGTEGLEMYATNHVLPHNRGVEVRTESNPIFVPTRPRTLIRLFSSN